jgi:hypothetical protein
MQRRLACFASRELPYAVLSFIYLLMHTVAVVVDVAVVVVLAIVYSGGHYLVHQSKWRHHSANGD